jgi:hypothetical protein
VSHWWLSTFRRDFKPVEAGDMFLRNVSNRHDYTASQPTRQLPTHLPPENLKFRAQPSEFCPWQGWEHLLFVRASRPVQEPVTKAPGLASSPVWRDTLDTASRTLSLLSTCTLPLSRTRRMCRTSPCSAAKCSCTSDGVSFCKRTAWVGVTTS